MQVGQPSRTAFIAARHRAVHQLVEQGSVFRDPLAVAILDTDAEALRREAEADPESRRPRLFIAARARFAEDALSDAFSAGTRQLVVLGAGLDTYAYRGTLREQLRIFEVDHPATQAWKRERLAAAGIEVPPTLTFAPVDFEHETLRDGLDVAGFDIGKAAFFTWLGVVPYLTEEAVWSTLRYVASVSGGAQVVFDYTDPPETLSQETLARHETRARRLASLGESLITSFEPAVLEAQLLATGFTTIEDLGPRKIAARYFGQVSSPETRGGHYLRAGTTSRRAR